MFTFSNRTGAWLGRVGSLFACASMICGSAHPQEVRLTATGFNSTHAFGIEFSTAPGLSYSVEVSADLVHWTSLSNLTASTTAALVLDADAGNFGRRYYHVGPWPTPITNMVYLPPGTFTMGSPTTEPGRNANEGPQTVVTISKGFWMGRYEVTQGDFIAVTGANDSLFIDLTRAVDFASWTEATNYCGKLTALESAAGRLPAGYLYRLPTEAEWEYACRAGTATPVAVGSGNSLSSAQANFDGTFPYNGAPTGVFFNSTTWGGYYPSNAWGLFDMHGNVAEWCQDLFAPYPGGHVTDPNGGTSGSIRVIRGGAYNNVGAACRSAKRDSRSQTLRNFGQGFRVVLAHSS